MSNVYILSDEWQEFFERVAAKRHCSTEEVLLEAIIDFYNDHYEEANT